MKYFFLILVRAYQLILSPILGGRCRFEPSCSQYAAEVLQTHPVKASLVLILKRLSKCHPWGGYGFDPVPSLESKERSLIS